ncbi:DUF4349 domain-containing protein [Fluviicola sp.]|uniref:DUF4349 domain-containing protein n=1 Tax=Fluviicola sp. TaxID=1917219 RepID=UPI003D2980CF
MKKSINLYLLAVLILVPIFFQSCSNEQNSNKDIQMASFVSDENTQFEEKSTNLSANSITEKSKEEKDQNLSQRKKKLIKKGNLSLKSKHIEKSKSRLDKALKSLDGYYDKEQFSKSDYEFRYSLQIRVPSKNFDKMLEVIDGGSDEIISKNIKTVDVSGEFLDIEARLKSKKAYLKRYEDLLTKAKTMEELLQIEDQIRELIEEIESQESRLSYLDDQVGYSTLNIQLVKVIPNQTVSHDPSFSDNAGNSFSKGWIGVKMFVLGLLSIWPLFVILIPTGIITYRKLKSPKK